VWGGIDRIGLASDRADRRVRDSVLKLASS
jgi:hypothetical protein